MYGKFETEIENLNQRVEQQARERVGARLLMTHPGVGPITAFLPDSQTARHWRVMQG
jgi:transposase